MSRKEVDNNPAAFAAKVQIRANVLAAIGAQRASVFDAFAGAGKLHDAVWSKAARYVGCDLKRQDDAREMFMADNRRVLRSVDLTEFNVFDLDAYGSPYEQAIIIAARRPLKPGERIGLVLTDGCGITYKANGVPGAVTVLTGLGQNLVGLCRSIEDLRSRAIAGLARRMGATVESRWEAIGKTAAAVTYIGLVLVGNKKPRR